jgi:hypothetical protein
VKKITLLVVAVCLLVSAQAWAIMLPTFATPRAQGMGNVGVAVCDDAAAWEQNPAGLAALDIYQPAGNTWANDAILAYSNYNPGINFNNYQLQWGGWVPDNRWGLGAGYSTLDGDSKWFGAGVGYGFKTVPLSLGASVTHNDFGGGFAFTSFDAGLLYRVVRDGKAPVRLGFVARDLSSAGSVGTTTYDAGISWPVTERLLIAADVIDLTGEFAGANFNAGVEWKVGRGYPWRLRAGMLDYADSQHIAAGVGYVGESFRADAAYTDIEGNALWSVGVGVGF